MKYRAYIYTLALLGALALAAVSGGLFTSSDNVVYAAEPPMFDEFTDERSVPENTPPGVNIGAPISATDPDETGDANHNIPALEFGQTLTYTLGGTDAASFDIDASTGQLITKAPLDAEDEDTYNVTVTVDDGETRAEADAVTQDVTITVTDVAEPPAAPYPPTVVSGEDNSNTSDVDESTTTLKVIWHAPENMVTVPCMVGQFCREFERDIDPTGDAPSRPQSTRRGQDLPRRSIPTVSGQVRSTSPLCSCTL